MDTFDLRKYLANNILLTEDIGNLPQLDPTDLKGVDLTKAVKETLDEDEILNEALATLVVGGILAAPKLINWLGKAIKAIQKFFNKKSETEVADSIAEFGHKWEKLYLKAIISVIKLTGFAKSQWKMKDGEIDEQKLVTIAKMILMVILIVAASLGIGGVISAKSSIVKALEGAFTGVKGTEIKTLLSTIMTQLPSFK